MSTSPALISGVISNGGSERVVTFSGQGKLDLWLPGMQQKPSPGG